ncbi:MAG: hypothetical protein ACK5O2_08355 [Microthrixaceae bacterium]
MAAATSAVLLAVWGATGMLAVRVDAAESVRIQGEQAPSVSTTNIAEAPEYFTETWSDPMDFTDAADWDPVKGRRVKLANASWTPGSVTYNTDSGGGRLYFVGAEPTEMDYTGGRQASHNRVNSSRFTRMSFRAYTDRDIVGLIVFNHCASGGNGVGDPYESCAGQGLKAINLRAGWHTYDLDMTGANDADSFTNPDFPNSLQGAAWANGSIAHVALQPSVGGVGGVNGVLDWVRIYQPGVSTATVNPNRAGTSALWHDGDANPANNGTPTNQALHAGVLRTLSGSRTVEFGALPAGGYRLVTSNTSGGATSAPTAVTVNARPRPVVIDPDVTGAGDWFTEVLANPKDFNDAGDVPVMFDGALASRNFNPGLAGGWLNATSAGQRDDPHLFLSDASWAGPAIDASLWHRVTWDISYEGAYGTNAVPGEGLDMRFCWFVVNGQSVCSRDVFPSTRHTTYTVSLKTPNPGDIEQFGGSKGLGWGGPASKMVHLFRLDPHEDPGNRNWHLGNVRLSHDDTPNAAGRFDVRFEDRAFEPGSVADVYVDSNGGDSNPGTRVVTNRAVSAGVNTVSVDLNPFTKGAYTINVVIRDPLGQSSTGVSTGPVNSAIGPSGAGPAAPATPGPGSPPLAGFEGVIVAGRTIGVGGWAIDPDGGKPQVMVQVNGLDVGRPAVAGYRPDIFNFFGGNVDPDSGWSQAIALPPGTHNVCVYTADSVAAWTWFGVGCRQAVVK